MLQPAYVLVLSRVFGRFRKTRSGHPAHSDKLMMVLVSETKERASEEVTEMGDAKVEFEAKVLDRL